MSPFSPVIDAFNREGVSYVVVGGVATVLHGHPRLTADIDYVIELSPENIGRAIGTLSKLGFVPRLPVDPSDFADPAKRRSWVEQKGMIVFSFFKKDNPLVGVDLFTEYPRPYDQLVARSVEKQLDGVKLRVCGVDDLIAIKEKAGRARDREDVRVLRIIHGK